MRDKKWKYLNLTRKAKHDDLSEEEKEELNDYFISNGPQSQLGATPVPSSSIFYNLPPGGMHALFLTSLSFIFLLVLSYS